MQATEAAIRRLQRDPAEDAHVWLVPCFFVRVGSRLAGTTKHLLDAAIEHAREYGTGDRRFPAGWRRPA